MKFCKFVKINLMKTDNIDYRSELLKARKNIEGLELPGHPDMLDAYMEVVCGDVLVCEQNMQERMHQWENASLTREFIDIVSQLEGYDHLLNELYSACSRMENCIHEHPRLKVEFLQLFLTIVRRIESQNGHDLSIAEDIIDELHELRRNIDLADYGRLEEIPQTGHLKSDPVEWTAEWEDVIDEVDKKVEAELGNYRGMGYCFGFWSTRTRILLEDYEIEWRSPSAMNTGMIFD